MIVTLVNAMRAGQSVQRGNVNQKVCVQIKHILSFKLTQSKCNCLI